jgi:hypothetical protein
MDDLLQWLSGESQRNTEYHNHKENMAWAATVFYIAGTISIGRFASDASRGPKIIIFFLMFLALIVFVPFLIFQFRNRRLAAKRAQTLLEQSFALLEDPSVELTENQRKVALELRGQYSASGGFDPVWTEVISYFFAALAFVISIFLEIT